MKHIDIETLVKKMNLDTATGSVHQRIQEVVIRLTTDLFKAIEDLDLSATEVFKGLEYFADAGKSNELGLLAAGLGLEHFLDVRADEADAKAGITGETPRTIEGPLYVAGAPESVGFARMDDGTESHQAEVLMLSGTVKGAGGQPLANAKVEIWHANLLGNYSFFDSSQSAFNLRRTILTDKNGHYEVQTIMPKGYGCPPDGTTQALLNQLGRHGNRPAHVHYFISADQHRKLTTQINIDGDEYLWDDFAFATRDGLVPAVTHVTDSAKIAAKGLSKPYAAITFDINLTASVDAVPNTVVDRRRVSA